MDWQTIDTAPRDGTRIQAWHKIHKCPVTVRWLTSYSTVCPWIEGTMTTSWPEDAFIGWMPLPPPPTEKARSE